MPITSAYPFAVSDTSIAETKPTRTARWPIRAASLAALKDLGMSDGTIASYFRVRPEEVAALRRSYGIAEPVRQPPPARTTVIGHLLALRRRA